MPWTVTLAPKARKALTRLPQSVNEIFTLLQREIEIYGPVRGDWPNYGKLGTRRHHCHLKKGRPTYVAVWEELAQGIKLVEVTYVGTHASAPY